MWYTQHKMIKSSTAALLFTQNQSFHDQDKRNRLFTLNTHENTCFICTIYSETDAPFFVHFFRRHLIELGGFFRVTSCRRTVGTWSRFDGINISGSKGKILRWLMLHDGIKLKLTCSERMLATRVVMHSHLRRSDQEQWHLTSPQQLLLKTHMGLMTSHNGTDWLTLKGVGGHWFPWLGSLFVFDGWQGWKVVKHFDQVKGQSRLWMDIR